jgi:hypothetical protein
MIINIQFTSCVEMEAVKVSLSSYLKLLLFIILQGCAVKLGLCKGEDHSTARLVAEFVLFEETFAPSA